jgi:hypothetical protein
MINFSLYIMKLNIVTKQFHELFEKFNFTNGFVYQMKDEKFENSILKNHVKNLNTFYGLRWSFVKY